MNSASSRLLVIVQLSMYADAAVVGYQAAGWTGDRSERFFSSEERSD